MPRVKIPNELKKAVSDLPDKEKNKLLLRLLASRPDLVEKLAYELLENGETRLERRQDLQAELEKTINHAVLSFYSPGYLLVDLRGMSGEINRHVKTTKDKYGEVALNFFMLNHTLDLVAVKTRYIPPHKSRTFNNYVVKRTIKLITLLEKLHEDYRLDFQDDLRKLANHIKGQPNMVRIARWEGLDVDAISSVS